MHLIHGVFSHQELGRSIKLTQIEQVYCAIIQIGCHLNKLKKKKVLLAFFVKFFLQFFIKYFLITYVSKLF